MARAKEGDPLLWFKVYIAETLSDENYQGWTCEERGAWFHLILMCYREGSIPASQDTLRRMLHLDAPAMSLVWQAIGSRFTVSPDAPGRLVSPRVEEERRKALRLIDVRSDAGEKGATARWNKPKRAHSKRITNASRPDAEAMRLDGEQNRVEESRTEAAATPPRGGLPTEDEMVGGRHPGCSALRVALAGKGLDLAWPAADKRQTIDAAVERVGLDRCVRSCVEDAKGMRAKPKSLGIFAATLETLRPLPPVDDYAAPWWARLAPDDLARYEREREEIDAELRGAPPGCVGARRPDDVRALITRYETEARQ